MRIRAPIGVVLLALLIPSGCSDARTPHRQRDAGSAADGGRDDQDAGKREDAGAPASCELPAPLADCGGLCGNGQLDAYTERGAHCTETCDGTERRREDCKALGFRGGDLECGSWCGFDVSGCDSCADDPRLSACTRPPFPGVIDYSGLALAAKGADELGLATLGGSRAREHRLRFTRFDRDFKRLSETPCFGPESPTDIALVRIRSSWLVTASSGFPFPRLELFRLDDAGDVVSARTVSERGAYAAVFSGKTQDDNLLLIWKQGLLDQTTNEGSLWGELLDADGESVKGPFQILDHSNLNRTHASVLVGDGFLVADAVRQYSDDEALVVLRVDSNGGVEETSRWKAHQFSGSSWAWNGREAHLLYARYGDFSEGMEPALYWQRFSKAGARIGPERLFERTGSLGGASYGSHPLLSLEQRTAVLRATGAPSAVKLEFMLINDAGDTLVTPFRISASSSAPLADFVQLGDRLVVAWVAAAGYVDSKALSLARVKF